VNLYVIEPDNINILGSIETSSVKSVCKSINKWHENGDINQLVPPFVVLHCVIVGNEIYVPNNSLYLHTEIEKKAGGYLVMRVHEQEHLFGYDEQDTQIPSSIASLVTVLKAKCHIRPALEGVGCLQRRFIDELRCLEPPAAGGDLARNLYFLLQNNPFVLQHQLCQIQSYVPQSVSP
jgi:hypothetical protein